MPPSLVTFFDILLQQKRIVVVTPIVAKQRLYEEQYSLWRLQQQVPSYLNTYDRLFRLVSIWLLHSGFDLSRHQPHQVLKKVCRLYCPDIYITALIEHRHALKKRQTHHVDEQLFGQLKQCYDTMEQALQAYIISLAQAELA